MSELYFSLKRTFLTTALIFGTFVSDDMGAMADDTLPATVSEWYEAVSQKSTDDLKSLVSKNFSGQSDYVLDVGSENVFIETIGDWYKKNLIKIISKKSEVYFGDEIIVNVCYRSVIGEFQAREIFLVSDQFITNFYQQRISDNVKRFDVDTNMFRYDWCWRVFSN